MSLNLNTSMSTQAFTGKDHTKKSNKMLPLKAEQDFKNNPLHTSSTNKAHEPENAQQIVKKTLRQFVGTVDQKLVGNENTIKRTFEAIG